MDVAMPAGDEREAVLQADQRDFAASAAPLCRKDGAVNVAKYRDAPGNGHLLPREFRQGVARAGDRLRLI